VRVIVCVSPSSVVALSNKVLLPGMSAIAGPKNPLAALSAARSLMVMPVFAGPVKVPRGCTNPVLTVVPSTGEVQLRTSGVESGGSVDAIAGVWKLF